MTKDIKKPPATGQEPMPGAGASRQSGVRQRAQDSPASTSTIGAGQPSDEESIAHLAHRINNLSAVISASVDALSMEPGLSDEVQSTVDDIQFALEGLRTYLGYLTNYAKQVIMVPRAPGRISVPKLINKLGLRRLIVADDNITFVMHVQPGVSDIIVDALSFQDTIINLVLNARNAMPEGGSLTINVCHKSIDSTHGVIPSGEYTAIHVVDSGDGIDPEDIENIFEPWYRGKDTWKSGSGLGLTSVKMTVESNNGHITVQSGLGVGTEFTMFFPCTDSDT